MVADITRDAVLVMAPRGNLDLDALSAQAEAADDQMKDQLQSCDDRYFTAGEPIGDRLFDWIKANRATIHIGTA